MAPKPQGKKFTANVKVTAIVGVELSAKTLEAALEQARTLNVSSCLTVDGEHVDSTFELVSVASDTWLDY